MRGELEEWASRLLAHVEHPPARIAMDMTSRLRSGDLERWAAGVAPLGREAAVHLSLAAARAAESCWTRLRPDDRRPGQALTRVARWLSTGADPEDPSALDAVIEALEHEPGYETEAAAARAGRAAILAAGAADVPTWAAVDAVREARAAWKLERERQQETPTEVELSEALLEAIREQVRSMLLDPGSGPPADGRDLR